MLKDDFYTIAELTHNKDTVQAIIQLEPLHKIFAGHFPGQPVLPGVCMVQIVREILETATNEQLRFLRASNVKFIALIDPNVVEALHVVITYNFTEETMNVSAAFTANATMSFRFQGTYCAVRANM